ncbi:Rv2578c family radical SAM protein [Arthrobacter sp. 35W]|uniref:Rv2578c family radical SAM protein n=1 Tax=Arthrobacter sp. 35W TaxID=1132441 RepID=UPI00047A3D1A|nr:Rv2578c family radical SAM protein [Arthrobacter sp. 35W]
MRWSGQELGRDTNDGALPPPGGEGPAAQLPLLPLLGLVRSVTTPDFAGITFHEVAAKSALNKVPSTSTMPFEWTINPYRGCSHACVYCFARKSHTYLDLDAGADFDSQLVVKVNVAEVLRRELAKPSWRRHHVALGTNTDPYQRAEGRYKLMPGIISALADSGTPFSILTKGTLLARDIPLLSEAAAVVPVGMGISLALTDEALASAVEPGTPSPKARLSLIGRLRDAGLPCGVMAMPILPWLTDGDDALESLFSSLSAAGATGVSAGALYLRPGTREWFMAWLARGHPALVGRYRRLYGSGAYASKEYRAWLSGRVAFFKKRHGFAGTDGFIHDAREEEAQYPDGALPGFRGPTAGPTARPATAAAVSADVQPALF